MRLLLIICFLISGSFLINAQTSDPVLFQVEDQDVNVSEFNYIYNKNNGDNADYSEESLREYLDLYIKFKLKVQRAKDMKLDTIVALKEELEGYRKQLAKSYLNDKEVVEGLIREIFDRKKKDIRVSHILIQISERDGYEKKLEALEKAKKLRASIIEGTDFERVAKLSSEDRNSSTNGGDIGFITAKLPDGFYEFENAIYSLKPGEISEPILSKVGYHIIKVTDTRDALGELEVSHLLIRKMNKGKVVPKSKEIAEGLYQRIMNGEDFEKLVKTNSQDMSSVNKGGYIGFFGINRFEKSFEQVAFSLKNDGDVSEPVETAVGWHIIKRISKADPNDYETMKRKIQKDVQRDTRLATAKRAMIQKIKDEANYTENQDVLKDFASKLDDEFYSYKWQVPELEKSTLISFDGGLEYTNSAFAIYCKSNARKRMRFDKGTPISESVNSLFQDFVDEKCTIYEEKNLEKKYPEFKSLMREYEEGILLFEATKMKVWDLASKDTIGLNAYFADHREDFKWSERAVFKKYQIGTADKKMLKKIKKYVKKQSDEKVLEKYNADGDLVTIEQIVKDKDSDDPIDISWKVGAISEVMIDEEDESASFYKLEEIKPAKHKTMGEARGYIIADYQDYLEVKWIEELRATYKVDIKEEVFKSLIKK